MKKLLFIFIIEVVVAVVAVVFVVAISTGNIDISGMFSDDGPGYNAAEGGGENLSATVSPPKMTLPHIRADIRYGDGGILDIRQEILQDAKSSFTGFMYARNFADVEITGVSADGGLASFSSNGFRIDVQFLSPSSKVTLEYRVKVKPGRNVMQTGPDMSVYTNFLAVPAVMDGQAVIEPYTWTFGDPFIYDLYDYDITVSCPEGWTACAPGKVAESLMDGRSVVVFSASNMRDFPLVIGRGLQVTQREYMGITVKYVNSEVCAAFVENSLKFASENIGPYPYNELFVVKAPIYPNSGMELSCMILLADRNFDSVEALKSVTYHEVFHEWFYGIIHTDQLNEPYLDEGLATMLAGLLRNQMPPDSGQRGFFGMKLKDYDSKIRYDQLSYTAASRYFGSLYNSMGEERFFEGLRRVYDKFAYKRMSYDGFMEVMNAAGE